MPTGRELILFAREEFLRDRLVGENFEDDEFNLWQNQELLGYISRAQDEACIRARLLVDSETTAVCTIDVTADEPEYDVHQKVLAVERAKLASMNKPLVKKSSEWLDNNKLDWEAKTGQVEYFLWDHKPRKLRLVGIPEDDDTLSLTVWRLPLVAVLLDEAPEIESLHHYNLLHWVCHLAYLKENSNTYNKEKADYHGGMFSGFFGERPSADVLEEKRRRYPMRSPARFF